MNEPLPEQSEATATPGSGGHALHHLFKSGWFVFIAVVATLATFVGYYDDIKTKGKPILCDLETIVPMGLDCISYSKDDIEKLKELQKQGKLTQLQAQTLEAYLAKEEAELIASLDKLAPNLSPEDRSRTANAAKETVRKGDELEQQAIELIKSGKAQKGFDLLAQEADRDLKQASQKLRRLAQLSYGISISTSYDAYQQLYDLGDAETWDIVYLIRLLVILGNLEEASDLALKTLKSIPSNEQRLRSILYDEVGDIQRTQGDLGAALSSYRTGLAIREKLAGQDPDNSERQRDLSVSFNKVGDIQRTQGDLGAALSSYQTGLAITQKLAGQDPDNSQWQRDLSVSFNRVGDIQRTQGDLGGALLSYQSGLAIRDKLAGLDPDNSQWQRDLYISHYKLAVLLVESDKGLALSELEKAIAVAKSLVSKLPEHPQFQREYRHFIELKQDFAAK